LDDDEELQLDGLQHHFNFKLKYRFLDQSAAAPLVSAVTAVSIM
jgi:hypothetical protein